MVLATERKETVFQGFTNLKVCTERKERTREELCPALIFNFLCEIHALVRSS